jgi:hypothetical protein
METSLRIYQEKALDLRLYLVFGSLLFLWLWMPGVIRQFDPTAGGIDPAIWLLIILSLLAFLGMAALCWWLLQRFWQRLGLPQLNFMVSQFKTLALWQQLGFYWVSFAWLLLVGALCLVAIC